MSTLSFAYYYCLVQHSQNGCDYQIRLFYSRSHAQAEKILNWHSLSYYGSQRKFFLTKNRIDAITSKYFLCMKMKHDHKWLHLLSIFFIKFDRSAIFINARYIPYTYNYIRCNIYTHVSKDLINRYWYPRFFSINAS